MDIKEKKVLEKILEEINDAFALKIDDLNEAKYAFISGYQEGKLKKIQLLIKSLLNEP